MKYLVYIGGKPEIAFKGHTVKRLCAVPLPDTIAHFDFSRVSGLHVIDVDVPVPQIVAPPAVDPEKKPTLPQPRGRRGVM